MARRSRFMQTIGLAVAIAALSSTVSPIDSVSATQLDVPPAEVPTNALPDTAFIPPAEPVDPVEIEEDIQAPPPGSPQEAEQLALEATIEDQQSQVEASFSEVEIIPSPTLEEPENPIESGDAGIEDFTDLGAAPASFVSAGMGLRREVGSSGCSPGPAPTYNASVEYVTTVSSVRNNSAGTYTLTIRNTGSATWTGGWSVATQVFDVGTQPYGGLGPATTVPTSLE